MRTSTNPENDYSIAPDKSRSDHDQLCAMNINSMHKAISLNIPVPGDYCNVVGSCTGLLCLEYKSSLTKLLPLWNPATQEVKELPRYNINSIPEIDGNYHVSLGFGFDSPSSNYKVVKIVKHHKISSVNRVEVYSLINDSWKEIEVKLLKFGVPRECYSPAFVKGSLYWSIKRHILLLFDVKSENLYTNSLPSYTRCDDLFEFKGSVTFIHIYSNVIIVWTLDDHSCWIKKSTINRLVVGKMVGYLMTRYEHC